MLYQFMSSDKDVEAVIHTVESKLGSDIVQNEQKRFFAIKLTGER